MRVYHVFHSLRSYCSPHIALCWTLLTFKMYQNPWYTRKDKKERKHVFIESSLLVIPTTLWMKTPGCARTSKQHLQAPSDFGPCRLACCSPCRRWGALASQGHLLLAPSRTLPVGTSPEEWFLAWPPSLDFLPLCTLLCFLPGSSHSYLLLILLPTKGTHFSAAGTQIFIKWTNAFQGPYIYYLMYDLWGNYFISFFY